MDHGSSRFSESHPYRTRLPNNTRSTTVAELEAFMRRHWRHQLSGHLTHLLTIDLPISCDVWRQHEPLIRGWHPPNPSWQSLSPLDNAIHCSLPPLISCQHHASYKLFLQRFLQHNTTLNRLVSSQKQLAQPLVFLKTKHDVYG